MNSELVHLVKGKWEYNLLKNNLICKNKSNLKYIFKNKDDVFFQDILSALERRGVPNPYLEADVENPTIDLPLEIFHRVLRANETIYEQKVNLKHSPDGLLCSSDYMKDFQINHHEYDDKMVVSIDPQRMCKITRRIRDRERVHAKIRLEQKQVVLLCEFPWTDLTIILPTIRR